MKIHIEVELCLENCLHVLGEHPVWQPTDSSWLDPYPITMEGQIYGNLVRGCTKVKDLDLVGERLRDFTRDIVWFVRKREAYATIFVGAIYGLLSNPVSDFGENPSIYAEVVGDLSDGARLGPPRLKGPSALACLDAIHYLHLLCWDDPDLQENTQQLSSALGSLVKEWGI